MAYYKKTPLKLYIQDVFRAKQSEQNKYVYEIFGKTFKNVMLHGVITSVYNGSTKSSYIQLSDATANIQVYCNNERNNTKLPPNCIEELEELYVKNYKIGDRRLRTESFMLEKIKEKEKNKMTFKKGDFVSIIGDIFVDNLKDERMIAAYEWYITSIERDLIWMEEMIYLYNNCYNKNPN
ncbi:uncharacterized protein LOC123720879 [Pieris brassicae]|uniref:uncharacterized protein LOC123720879 n=1 Tax=Pieris brassicae TaxID=7116 RepID=UPI001E66166F|nr:uncharacterized protein LOC123720879 [Pieris brassicae]